jgi:hypothetical protein
VLWFIDRCNKVLHRLSFFSISLALYHLALTLQFLQQWSNSYQVALFYIKALDDPEGKKNRKARHHRLSDFSVLFSFSSHFRTQLRNAVITLFYSKK